MRTITRSLISLLISIPIFLNGQVHHAYIPNITSDDVTVIDLQTNEVVATIPVVETPFGIDFSPDCSLAYVAHFGQDSIAVINTQTQTVVDWIAEIGTSPRRINITPDGSKAYVSDAFDVRLYFVDLTDNSFTSEPVSSSPSDVVFTPDGSTAFVVRNKFNGTVDVYDVATDSKTNEISILQDPIGIDITPDGTTLFVANFGSDTVSVIDVASETVTNQIEVGVEPFDVEITPDGSKVYVTNTDDNTVSVIRTATETVVATITVGTFPNAIDFTKDGATAYVTNRNSNNISVIDVASDSESSQISVGVGIGPAGVGNFICEMEVAIVPTLSEWSLIVLALLLVIVGVVFLRVQIAMRSA